MRSRVSIILLTVLIWACVDPFTAETEKVTERIVVEGGITNQPPPYRLAISRTANFSQDLDGIPRPVTGATVQVCDDAGNCIPFFEVSRGNYETAANAPPGEIGKTYHIEITTPEGKKIESIPQQIRPSPPMLRVYSEFDPASVLDEGFTVYVDTDDPAGEQNYYKWETDNFYPYSERFCFTHFYERDIQYIASDKNIDGNILSRVPVKVIGYSSSSLFVVQVYQLAISAEAYAFLDKVKKQATTSGSIFDPPPTFLRGNLFNREDATDEVLGFFIVAGVSRKDVVVDRSAPEVSPQQSEHLVREPLYCGDPCDQLCVAYGGGTCGIRPCPPDCAALPGITNIAPDAWPLPHQECGD